MRHSRYGWLSRVQRERERERERAMFRSSDEQACTIRVEALRLRPDKKE